MAEGLSAEQVRDRHIRDMGRELGCVYSALMNDVTLLHAKWSNISSCTLTRASALPS